MTLERLLNMSIEVLYPQNFYTPKQISGYAPAVGRGRWWGCGAFVSYTCMYVCMYMVLGALPQTLHRDLPLESSASRLRPLSTLPAVPDYASDSCTHCQLLY